MLRGRKLTVIVALEHRIYRDAIAAALQEPFPDVDIASADPSELERLIGSMKPVAVIADRLDTRLAPKIWWICLDQDSGRRATLHSEGQVLLALEPGLNGLIALLEQALSGQSEIGSRGLASGER